MAALAVRPQVVVVRCNLLHVVEEGVDAFPVLGADRLEVLFGQLLAGAVGGLLSGLLRRGLLSRLAVGGWRGARGLLWPGAAESRGEVVE